jgi:hypothetical protein
MSHCKFITLLDTKKSAKTVKQKAECRLNLMKNGEQPTRIRTPASRTNTVGTVQRACIGHGIPQGRIVGQRDFARTRTRSNGTGAGQSLWDETPNRLITIHSMLTSIRSTYFYINYVY